MPIKRCSCINQYQDKKYGKFMRVMNPCGTVKSKLGADKHRCTVCGKEL